MRSRPAPPWLSSIPTASRTNWGHCLSLTRWRIIKESRRPEAAKALANYLLSPNIEAALADGPKAQIPLLSTSLAKARVETPKTVHAMEADFEAAVKVWDETAAYLAALFGGE